MHTVTKIFAEAICTRDFRTISTMRTILENRKIKYLVFCSILLHKDNECALGKKED